MIDQQPHEYSSLVLKILGAILGFLTLRWMAKIFRGKDNEFSVKEFGRMVGTLFFLTAGGYMIWAEAHRTTEAQVYGPAYIAIVFASLLTILHMEEAFDRVLLLMDKIIELKNPTKPKDDKPE